MGNLDIMPKEAESGDRRPNGKFLVWYSQNPSCMST